MDGCRRFRVLGPLYESQSSPDGLRFKALRPLFSRIEHPDRRRSLTEVIWPVGMFKDLGTDRSWRFLPFYGNDFDIADPVSRRRFSLFPLLWAGRDTQGEKYFGLFPLGGRIHEILGQDTVDFALFPLYLRSTQKEKQSTSILWPLYSRTTGDEQSGFRVFPFYGVSRNDSRWVKRFVMWPIWTSVTYLYPGDEGGGGVLFPLYGRLETVKSRTTWVLPPLFRFTRGDAHSRVFCPYPFVQIEHGDVEKLYLWPLWGRRHDGVRKSGFFLYPFGWYDQTLRHGETLSRFKFRPVWHNARRTAIHDDDNGNRVEEDVGRYVKVWPLCSYRREGDISRFRVVDLWPDADSRGVEKNYAPLWTLYVRTHSADACESELLWGIYRHRKDESGHRLSLFPLFNVHVGSPDAGSWSLLKGLVGYEREDERRSLRLLYLLNMRLGKGPEK